MAPDASVKQPQHLTLSPSPEVAAAAAADQSGSSRHSRSGSSSSKTESRSSSRKSSSSSGKRRDKQRTPTALPASDDRPQKSGGSTHSRSKSTKNDSTHSRSKSSSSSSRRRSESRRKKERKSTKDSKIKTKQEEMFDRFASPSLIDKRRKKLTATLSGATASTAQTSESAERLDASHLPPSSAAAAAASDTVAAASLPVPPVHVADSDEHNSANVPPPSTVYATTAVVDRTVIETAEDAPTQSQHYSSGRHEPADPLNDSNNDESKHSRSERNSSSSSTHSRNRSDRGSKHSRNKIDKSSTHSRSSKTSISESAHSRNKPHQSSSRKSSSSGKNSSKSSKSSSRKSSSKKSSKSKSKLERDSTHSRSSKHSRNKIDKSSTHSRGKLEPADSKHSTTGTYEHNRKVDKATTANDNTEPASIDSIHSRSLDKLGGTSSSHSRGKSDSIHSRSKLDSAHSRTSATTASVDADDETDTGDGIGSSHSRGPSNHSKTCIEKHPAHEFSDSPGSTSSHRRRYAVNKPRPKTRSVSRYVTFCPTVQFTVGYSLDDYTDEECHACWYTPEEYQELRNNVYNLVDCYELGKSSSIGDVTYRGLDKLTKIGTQVQDNTIRAATNAVLCEVDMQWQEFDYGYDMELLAYVYTQFTQESKRVALQWGLRDAREVERILEEDANVGVRRQQQRTQLRQLRSNKRLSMMRAQGGPAQSTEASVRPVPTSAPTSDSVGGTTFRSTPATSLLATSAMSRKPTARKTRKVSATSLPASPKKPLSSTSKDTATTCTTTTTMSSRVSAAAPMSPPRSSASVNATEELPSPFVSPTSRKIVYTPRSAQSQKSTVVSPTISPPPLLVESV